MKCAALENRSTVFNMTVLPADGGRPVMKTREICGQRHPGVGSGRRSLTGELTTFQPKE